MEGTVKRLKLCFRYQHPHDGITMHDTCTTLSSPTQTMLDKVTDLQRALVDQGSPVRFLFDTPQLETLLLPALQSKRQSVVSAALECLRGLPIKDGGLSDLLLFKLYDRFALVLTSRCAYSYATLQLVASFLPHFFALERVHVEALIRCVLCYVGVESWGVLYNDTHAHTCWHVLKCSCILVHSVSTY